MAKSPITPITSGADNLASIRKDILAAYTKVKKLREQRGDINSKISETRASLEPLGVPKEAFDNALSYMNWDQDKRQGYDFAYALCREGMGMPIHADLFNDAAATQNADLERKLKVAESKIFDMEAELNAFRAQRDAGEQQTGAESEPAG